MNNLSNVNFEKINDIAYANEENVVKELLEYLTPEYNSRLNNIKVRAGEIVTDARKSIGLINSPIDNLLQEYQLNTNEGTILLCLAAALLRLPDKKTIDRLL